ncbi:MAG: hypothetical protein IJB23_07600 [Alistipes sp.]|nr:hypothetical protein [Alistipes sp.]MBQ7951577.1 hypothetical protein [Alistipes sp.]MBQ9962725.1 hypothetical protein [Alistipes sp.]
MKKILILLLAAVVSITAVEAQQLSKRELKAQKKALQKEVAGYVAEGWKVLPGELNISEQVTRSKSFKTALDDNGEQKYVVAQVTAVGQTYKAALFAAQNGAKVQAANALKGELEQLTKIDLANVEDANKEAISVDKVVSAAMERVSASLGQGVILTTMHREVAHNGNVEIVFGCAYSYKKIKELAVEAQKKSLKEEIDELRKQL